MAISVVVPAYNEEHYLQGCLRALTNYRTDDVLEIIVVDNASTDHTAEVVRSFPGVKLISEPKKGLTCARQAGLKAAKGDFIASVDADTIIPPHWFSSIQCAFQNHPDLVCLSGPYDFYDLSRTQRLASRLYWRLLATPVYCVVGYMMVGGNFAAKRTALERAGGFDESIAFYGEDTDIARRLSKQGRVLFDLHFRVSSSGRRLAQQGTLRIAGIYGLNYASQVLLHRPLTRRYKDVR